MHGLPAAGIGGNVLIVANHISWLDIFVLHRRAAGALHRQVGARALAAGRAADRATGGTLFIERERRRDTHRSTGTRPRCWRAAT